MNYLKSTKKYKHDREDLALTILDNLLNDLNTAAKITIHTTKNVKIGTIIGILLCIQTASQYISRDFFIANEKGLELNNYVQKYFFSKPINFSNK